jgi:hypothetical protein
MTVNLEKYLNDQCAEIYALRLILQVLLSRLLDMTEKDAEALAAFEQEVEELLTTPPSARTGQAGHGPDQLRRATLDHTKSFFQRLRAIHEYRKADLA